MPAPAASAVTDIRQEMLAVEQQILTVYSRVRGGRGRLSTAQRVRAERDLAKRIDSLTAKTNKFYSNRLPELFLQGAKEAYPDYQLQDDDLALLAKIQDEGLIKVQVSNELAKRDIDRWGQVAEGSRFKSGTKKHQVRGIVTEAGARLRPQQYSGLVMAADASRVYNFGLVTGARAAGYKKVIVHDGTGCGLRSHDDPEQANGLVLTLDTALSNPISHPYCVRSFEPYDGDRKAKGTFKKLAKTSAKVVAAGAVAGVAGATALRVSPSLQARLTTLIEKANPDFKAYRQRVLQVARVTQESVDDIELALREEMEDWASDVSTQLSERARVLLGMDATAPRKVVGDTYDNLLDFDRLRFSAETDLRMLNSIGGHLTSMVVGEQAGTVSWRLPRVFSNRRGLGSTIAGTQGRISGRVGRDLSASITRRVGTKFRFGASLPGLESNVIPFVNIMPHQLVRYRISRVKHGVANRLVLNPNGMLRAGFAIDPRTGFVTPSLKFLPKGPIRIFTEVNRSPGRLQQGALLKTELEKGLSLSRSGEFENSFREILSRGARGQPGFLRASDFNKGFVKDQFLVTKFPDAFGIDNDVIRRGRISRALSVEDPASGKRVHVDLLIRNGKFVTEHKMQAGRITSVTAEARLSVFKFARFNIRTNLNLRELQLDSLKDIRHLTLRDLQKVDPRHAWRVRSFALQLHAFDRTIWQIGKTLRVPWEDAQRMWRDARRAAEIARNGEILHLAGAEIAKVLGVSSLSRDEVLGLLRDLPQKVKDRLGDVPTILRYSAEALRQKYIDDPIRWVFGSMDRLASLGKVLEMKYKRPNVVKMFPEEDTPVLRFNMPGDARTAESLSEVTYLTPQEISHELNISLQEAQQVHERAMAYFVMDLEDLASINNVPEELRLYIGVEPKFTDVDTFFTEHQAVNFFAQLETAEHLAQFGELKDARIFSARARMIERDIKMAAAMIEDRYPDGGRVRFRVAPDMVQNHSEFSGFWVPNGRNVMHDSYLTGWRTEAEFDEYVRSMDDKIPEIWLSKKLIMGWELPDDRPMGIDVAGGVWDGLHTVVHELGHHAHLAGADDIDISNTEDFIFQSIKRHVKDPNFSYNYQKAVSVAQSIPAEDRMDLIKQVEVLGRNYSANEHLPDFIKNPDPLRPLTQEDYSQLEDYISVIDNNMRGLIHDDIRSTTIEFLRESVDKYASGVTYTETLEDMSDEITDLENWIDRNQNYLIQNYMSEYGTSMGVEFVAEAFAQRWLRGDGKREDPFGEIIDRMMTWRRGANPDQPLR